MSKLKVRDLMTTQVVTLKPDDTSSARTTFSVCFSSTRRHWMTTVPDQ